MLLNKPHPLSHIITKLHTSFYREHVFMRLQNAKRRLVLLKLAKNLSHGLQGTGFGERYNPIVDMLGIGSVPDVRQHIRVYQMLAAVKRHPPTLDRA